MGAAALITLTACASGGSGETIGPARVDVVMRDYTFTWDGPIPAGRVVFRAGNAAEHEHQMTLLSLPDDLPPIETQLRGETRRLLPLIAKFPARSPGATGTFAVDLKPGRHALVCFLIDPDGVSHALKGMASEFRVAPAGPRARR